MIRFIIVVFFIRFIVIGFICIKVSAMLLILMVP